MQLELTFAAFFFLVALLLAWFSWNVKRPEYLIASGLIWLVLGVASLSGLVIQGQAYTYDNYSYVNITQVQVNGLGAVQSSQNIPVISSINKTVSYTAFTLSSNPTQLSSAGLFGFSMMVIGLITLIFGIVETQKKNTPAREDESEF